MLRPEKKSESTSSSAKKGKAVSKLSHDLFGSGSFQDNDSGDLFSPTESKEFPKAAPLPATAAKPASRSRKDSLFGNYFIRIFLIS